jgi:hypothetical protein
MGRKTKIKFSQLWQQVDFTKFSTLSLIFSNLLVIIFAVVDRLSAINILWIYWAQSVIIGIFNFIKILSLKEFSTEGFRQGNKPVLPTRGAKISTAFFFLFHYGFFHFIYAMFLGSFSKFGISKGREFETSYFLYSTGMFFISYLVEFINSRKEETDDLPNLGKIMFTPYARIIPMHLTIILGGFIGAAGSFLSADTNIAIIVLFIGIKTVVDLITHSLNFDLLKNQLLKASD